jgi:hypothetical protein
MPRINADQLTVNQPIEAAAPDAELSITVDPARPLPVGVQTFQLEVVDDAGNRSQPTQVRVIVLDDQAPTAVISAPRTVSFGQSFTLSGQQSVDVGGGNIVRFIWTLVS